MLSAVNARMARIEGGQSVYFMALQNQLRSMQLAMHNQMIQIKDQLKDHVDDEMTQIKVEMTQMKDQFDDKMTQIKDQVDDETTQIKDQLKFMQGELAKVQPQQANMNAGLPAPFVSPFKNWWASNVQECSLSMIVFNDLMTAVKRSRLYGDKTMTMDYLRCLVVFELGLKWTNEGARGHWYLPGYKIV